MIFEILHPHRVWLALLSLAVIAVLVGGPVSDWALENSKTRAENIAKERADAEKALARFHDDMQMLQNQDHRLSADDVARILAPTDRLQAGSIMEKQAASDLFSHFTYTVSPEKRLHTADADHLSESLVNLSADMPLDTDAAVFLRSLGHTMPGRIHLRHVKLSRISMDAPPSLANIHMEADLVWLSNGTNSDMAEVR